MLRPKAAKKAVLVFLFIVVVLMSAVYALLPTYAATFVLTSEAEVSEVELSFERQPITQAFQSRLADRLFAWDTIVARGTRPNPFVEVTWRGPDGRRHFVRQFVVNEDGGSRCIHAIRLNGTGEPVPVGVRPDGAPRLIESRCR